VVLVGCLLLLAALIGLASQEGTTNGLKSFNHQNLVLSVLYVPHSLDSGRARL
jgi:hypothetical protein